MRSGRVTVPAILATAAVVLALLAGIVALGAPSTSRQRRLDARRVADLIEIGGGVDDYWNRRKALPPSLDTLVSDLDLVSLPHDPVTKAPYPYSVTAPSAFRLCATFEQPSEDDRDQFGIRYGLNLRRWQHAIGPTCFDLTPHSYSH